jgi:hypothetical protein
MRKAKKPLWLIATVYYPSYRAHLASIVQRISASQPLHLLSIVINGTHISPRDVENHFDRLARERSYSTKTRMTKKRFPCGD